MQDSFISLRQLEHHIDDSVRLYPNQEADDYPPHWHNSVELIMPVENVYTVMISDTAYHIHPGELFMVPPREVHEIFAPEEGFRYLFLLDQKELYAIEGMSEIQHVLYPCVHLREDRDGPALGQIREYFVKAVREYGRDGGLAPAKARLWLRLGLASLAEYVSTGAAGERAGDTPHHQQLMTAMMEVCKYISEHCAERLTLDGVAAHSGYSKYHFARLFKLYAGMGFYDYYMRQRVVLCRHLLSDPALRVTDVALQAGFDSIATFNRVFKQHEGVTPSQYRRMKQNKRGADDRATE